MGPAELPKMKARSCFLLATHLPDRRCFPPPSPLQGVCPRRFFSGYFDASRGSPTGILCPEFKTPLRTHSPPGSSQGSRTGTLVSGPLCLGGLSLSPPRHTCPATHSLWALPLSCFVHRMTLPPAPSSLPGLIL